MAVLMVALVACAFSGHGGGFKDTKTRELNKQIKELNNKIKELEETNDKLACGNHDENDVLAPLYKFKLPYVREDGTKGTACYAKDEMVKSFTSLAIDPAYLEHLDSLDPITKKIHVVWTGPDLLTKLHDEPLVRYGVGGLKKLNPEWEFKVYDEEDINSYMQKNLPANDWTMMKGANLVTKTDVFRLLLMFNEGGLYQDVDRHYNIPLNELIGPNTKMLLPTAGRNFVSDFVCSGKGNRLFKRALDIYLCKMREQSFEGLTNWTRLTKEQLHVVTTEAMGTFWAAATDTLFGRPIWGVHEHFPEEQEGQTGMDHIRMLLNATTQIKTGKEVWCHLLTAEMPDCTNDKGVWGDVGKERLWHEASLLQWDREPPPPDEEEELLQEGGP